MYLCTHTLHYRYKIKRMSKTRILYVAHQMQPYIKLTELADVVRKLPAAMQEQGIEIRILIPRHGLINERRHRLHEVVRLSGINIIIGDNDNPLVIKVATLPEAKMQVYFLDSEDYFNRKGITHDQNGKFYADNHEKMIFFCKGVLDTVVKLGWAPDVVHCNGWMTSLMPLYIKKLYQNNPAFRNAKVVYSVYEQEFSEEMSPNFIKDALYEDVSKSDLDVYAQGCNRDLDLGAIAYADAVVLATKDISPEVAFAISQTDKPVLDASELDDFAGGYKDFYHKILSLQPELA